MKETKMIIDRALRDLTGGLEFLSVLKKAGCLPRLDTAARFALCSSSSWIIRHYIQRTGCESSTWSRTRAAMEKWVTSGVKHICQTGCLEPWHATSAGFSRPSKATVATGTRATLYLHNTAPAWAYTDSGSKENSIVAARHIYSWARRQRSCLESGRGDRELGIYLEDEPKTACQRFLHSISR